MKKKRTIIFILLFLCFFSICNIKNVKADLGWDSSYDSGSSYSSDSSWSSSSSWDDDWSFSESDSGSSSFFDFIMFIIMIVIIVGAIIDKKFKIKQKNLNKRYEKSVPLDSSNILFNNLDGNIEKIKTRFPKLDIDRLREELYNKFITLQEAWMNFDYEILEKLCSNTLYNTCRTELDALKLKNGKNVMSDFVKINDKIIDVDKTDDIVIIKYYLDVSFYDYVINSKTNSIVKGNKKYKVHNIYILVFIKNTKLKDICPNCGAHIEAGTTKCEHCKAVIVQDSNEFVLIEKRKIN